MITPSVKINYNRHNRRHPSVTRDFSKNRDKHGDDDIIVFATVPLLVYSLNHCTVPSCFYIVLQWEIGSKTRTDVHRTYNCSFQPIYSRKTYQVARSYEKYKVTKLVFTHRNQCPTVLCLFNYRFPIQVLGI